MGPCAPDFVARKLVIHMRNLEFNAQAVLCLCLIVLF